MSVSYTHLDVYKRQAFNDAVVLRFHRGGAAQRRSIIHGAVPSDVKISNDKKQYIIFRRKGEVKNTGRGKNRLGIEGLRGPGRLPYLLQKVYTRFSCF